MQRNHASLHPTNSGQTAKGRLNDRKEPRKRLSQAVKFARCRKVWRKSGGLRRSWRSILQTAIGGVTPEGESAPSEANLALWGTAFVSCLLVIGYIILLGKPGIPGKTTRWQPSRSRSEGSIRTYLRRYSVQRREVINMFAPCYHLYTTGTKGTYSIRIVSGQPLS